MKNMAGYLTWGMVQNYTWKEYKNMVFLNITVNHLHHVEMKQLKDFYIYIIKCLIKKD